MIVIVATAERKNANMQETER